MCLEPEHCEKFFTEMKTLSYEGLKNLDRFQQENTTTSMDEQLHHLIKVALKLREGQVIQLEKCFALKKTKGNLLSQILKRVKNLGWFLHAANAYQRFKKKQQKLDETYFLLD